ncbi:MAG: hypothetical protein HYY96_01885 [Candidatus Tectomicrobia bacterium]|nr:hypothetical protein [Candidatus Tectomicrobia bacterium]
MFPQEISNIGRINFAGATAHRVTNWPFRRIFSYFSRFKRELVFILLSIVLAAVARTLVPLILRNIIDHQIVAYEPYRLALTVLLLISLTLGAALVGIVENHVNTSVTQHVILNLRQELYERLQESSLQKLTNTATGDLLSRCTNDLTGVQEVLARSFALSTANLVTVLATCVVMFYLDA